MDDKMNGHGYVPVKLYLQIQIWTIGNKLIPALREKMLSTSYSPKKQNSGGKI